MAIEIARGQHALLVKDVVDRKVIKQVCFLVLMCVYTLFSLCFLLILVVIQWNLVSVTKREDLFIKNDLD